MSVNKVEILESKVNDLTFKLNNVKALLDQIQQIYPDNVYIINLIKKVLER